MERHPTEQKVLDATVRIIDEHGEAAVRIHDIQIECDVTAPSIYHFFGSREGLVIEAQADRLRRSFDANDAILDATLTDIASRDEARAALRDATRRTDPPATAAVEMDPEPTLESGAA